MKRLLFLTLAVASLTVQAQEISQSELRLRETLRNTMLQLRTAQSERANLQADKIQNEARIQELEGKTAELNKKIEKISREADEEQQEARRKQTELEAHSATQAQKIAQLQEALEKWKAGYADAVRIAKEREALRAKAASKGVLLERRLAERERQNLSLYETGSEILERLEGFSLGTALTAREPFVGTTRVKLQNLVQDYGDRLKDSKYNPFAKEAPALPPAASEPTSAPAASKPENSEDERRQAAEIQTPQRS